MLGLYIHIPFCSAICNYCNFNRGLFDAALKGRYVEALIAEIRAAGVTAGTTAGLAAGARVCTTTDLSAGAPSSIDDVHVDTGPWDGLQRVSNARADTIFFGGGTPSLLEPAEIQRLIETCEHSFELAGEREVTLEANPESVTGERLAAYRAAGVNRLSFGVQ